ncbi:MULTISPECIES: hypothetical protein [unclassified Arthrobacter]|uniref:hypothetical protein n=1 Tax=unclassified Arthrobacter TaxID=235627 RepID=UPI0015E372D2|nr:MULTISPECIES: hypothetical protein [unclassified Arthrobacter]
MRITCAAYSSQTRTASCASPASSPRITPDAGRISTSKIARPQNSFTDSANAIANSKAALPQEARNAVHAATGRERSATNLKGVTCGEITSGYAVKLEVEVDPWAKPRGGACLAVAPATTAGRQENHR